MKIQDDMYRELYIIGITYYRVTKIWYEKTYIYN